MSFSGSCATVCEHSDIKSTEEVFNRGQYCKIGNKSASFLLENLGCALQFTLIIENFLLSRKMVVDAAELESERFAFIFWIWDLDKR